MSFSTETENQLQLHIDSEHTRKYPDLPREKKDPVCEYAERRFLTYIFSLIRTAVDGQVVMRSAVVYDPWNKETFTAAVIQKTAPNIGEKNTALLLNGAAAGGLCGSASLHGLDMWTRWDIQGSEVPKGTEFILLRMYSLNGNVGDRLKGELQDYFSSTPHAQELSQILSDLDTVQYGAYIRLLCFLLQQAGIQFDKAQLLANTAPPA